MIKYIGSKRVLVPRIVELVRSLPGVRTVADLFSGTSRVGHALKAAGYRVLANDHNRYAATLARAYVEADPRDLAVLDDLARLPGRPGWFTETYCERSRFFQPHNGARVDTIRDAIVGMGADPELEAILLVSLMEAADRVDSTTGVQMAYLKQWAGRSYKALELRPPALLPQSPYGKGRATEGDAEAFDEEVDLVYLDPPYNQHKYLGNYHIWESLVRWDRPEVYGVACKRVDCRERTSVFNSRPGILPALRRLVARARCRYLLVSFNNEGYVARAEMEALLATRGEVRVIEHDFKRYVGAQIGIYGPTGTKVGRVSHLRNTEYLFLVTCAGT